MSCMARLIPATVVSTLLATSVSFADPSALTISTGGGTIHVRIPDGDYNVSRDDITAWIRKAAHAVTTYYGRFPVSHLDVEISSRPGNDIGGRTYGWKFTVVSPLGRQVDPSDLGHDWVMTHEMIHMAFPDVPDDQDWIKEGLSTYVERIARAQIGDRDVPAMWDDLMRKIPQGLPAPGDRGLDHTHTWGRTYWGGAMFCLLADVRIREHTQNRYGLEDALRAIVDAGGTLDHQWSIEHAFRIGDDAVGVPVLMDLYDRMKDRPYTPDLDALWRRLGVISTGDGVRLDDDAPLASVRQAITAGPAATMTR